MTELRIGQPLLMDGSKPLYVRLLGIRPGDGVEVQHGAASAPLTWNSRMEPLPWLRATQEAGEFLIDVAHSGGRVSFVVTLAQPGSVGASVIPMGTSHSVDHPGATPEGNRPWYVLALEPQFGGRVLVTAQNSGGRDDKNRIPNIDSLSVVVDISLSMTGAARDGRLARALESVRQAAQRSNLASITAVFVADRPLPAKVIPVESSITAVLAGALDEHGNRTGVASDLVMAGADFGHSRNALFVISDNPPAPPPGRRAVSVATSPSDPPIAGSLYLRVGESEDELTNRMVAAVPVL